MNGWAIAGAGAVASIGRGVDEVFAALCAGRSGHAPLRAFDRTRYRVRHAYEIDDRASNMDHPGRATGWLLAVIDEALRRAGQPDRLDDIPVLVGTGLRELRGVELWWRDGIGLHPADLHFGTALRERYGATRTYTIANACAAGLYACGLAADLLEAGEADTVVVAGTDALTESMFALLDRVHPQPPDVLRPFDGRRRGVVLGEGAAAVVLRRTGPARAVLRSVALNCDAYHVTAPDPEGIARAMREALERAGTTPESVGVVYAHGTGTLLNDAAEATALCKVFGAAGARPLVTAVKSMTGHTSGGSGLLSLVCAMESLRTGLVPPVAHLRDETSEAAGLSLVRGACASASLELAQVNAFGFGGLNAVALVGTA